MFDTIPFVRFLLFLIGGVLLGEHVPKIPYSNSIFIVLGAILLLLCLNKTVLLRSIGLFGIITLLGYYSSSFSVNKNEVKLSSLDSLEYRYWFGEITSLPENSGKYLRAHVNLKGVITKDGKELSIKSEALVYFEKSKIDYINVIPGAIIYARTKLIRPFQSKSSLQFDYRKYLERKGIPWVVYISKSENVHFLEQEVGRSWRYLPETVVTWSDRVFYQFIPNKEAYGLVKAMLLGRRDHITSDLNNAFISSGAVHILSVSGLHVGIFFIVLNYLLGFLKKSKSGRWLFLFLIVSSMCFYAVVTGLPASVQRAVIMTIIWTLADTFKRKGNSVNTLSLAGYVILLVDPLSIYDIGLQLSFLAMLGIFMIAVPIQSMFEYHSKIVKHFASMVTMSIAAQLFTLPLIFYYFHQFPTYFIVTNLLIIDVATLLLPLSMLLLLSAFSPLTIVSEWIGYLVSWLAQITNYIVRIPERLPHSVITGVYWDGIQIVIFFVLLALVYTLFLKRSVKLLGIITVCTVIGCMYSFWKMYAIYSDSSINSFEFKDSKIVGVKSKDQLVLVGNKTSFADSTLYNRQIMPYVDWAKITVVSYSEVQ